MLAACLFAVLASPAAAQLPVEGRAEAPAEDAAAATQRGIEQGSRFAADADVLGTQGLLSHGMPTELSGAAVARVPLGLRGGYIESYVLEWSEDDVQRSFDVLRRAVGQSAGVRGTFTIGGGLRALVGFRRDGMAADPAAGRSSSYDDREWEAGLGLSLRGVGARAFYGYRPGSDTDEFGQPRERHRIKLEIGHNVSDWLRLRAQFLSKIHDSNNGGVLPSEKGSYLACIGFEAKY